MYIVYKDDLDIALQFAKENAADTTAIHLVKAAKIVRKDIFEMKQTF